MCAFQIHLTKYVDPRLEVGYTNILDFISACIQDSCSTEPTSCLNSHVSTRIRAAFDRSSWGLLILPPKCKCTILGEDHTYNESWQEQLQAPTTGRVISC